MSDNEIRKILIEEKRREKQMQRRAELADYAAGFLGFGGIAVICFMLSIIG